MKSLLLSTFAIIICVMQSFSQPSETIKNSISNTKEQEQIIKLSQQKWGWMADKKTEALKTLFDEKAMFVHMGGSWGKETELETIKGGGIWYKKAEVYATAVNIIGKTAILLSDIDLVAVVGGNEVTNPFMVTEVYIKESGTWKLGSLSFTKLIRPVKVKDRLQQQDKGLQEETAIIKEVDSTHTLIYTDILINAPATKVWKILRDFDNMPNWSSTLKGLTGDISNGGEVVVKFDLGNGQVLDIPRSPLIYEEGVLFGWAGKLRLEGLTDNHLYKVEAISQNRTRFIQTEEFKGTNPNITPKALAELSIKRYKIFNKELKVEVEKKQ